MKFNINYNYSMIVNWLQCSPVGVGLSLSEHQWGVTSKTTPWFLNSSRQRDCNSSAASLEQPYIWLLRYPQTIRTKFKFVMTHTFYIVPEKWSQPLTGWHRQCRPVAWTPWTCHPGPAQSGHSLTGSKYRPSGPWTRTREELALKWNERLDRTSKTTHFIPRLRSTEWAPRVISRAQ